MGNFIKRRKIEGQKLIATFLRHYTSFFIFILFLYATTLLIARDYSLFGTMPHEDLPTVIAEIATLTALFLAFHQIRKSQEIFEIRDYRELLENLTELAVSCQKDGGTIYYRCLSPAVGFSRICADKANHDSRDTVFGDLEDEFKMLQANYRTQKQHVLRCANWGAETVRKIGINDAQTTLIDAAENKYNKLRNLLSSRDWSIAASEENLDSLTPHFFILEQNGSLQGLVWAISGHSRENGRVDAIKTSSYPLLSLLKGSMDSLHSS
jgi:hypothetical protein